MNFEINSKIEDIQQVLSAWRELQEMRERCKNPQSLDEAQAGLDRLIIALLMDVAELYQKESAGADDDDIFDETLNGVEEIIQTAAQIFFSRNGFRCLLMTEDNKKFTERLEKINCEINALLITTAEELVKEYVKVSDNE